MTKQIKELLVLHFLNDGVRTTFVTLLPFIAGDLKFSLASVGFLGSAQPLFASILALPAGFFASRFGGFKLLTSLLIIYSLGALLTSISTSLILVTISFFVAASGFGMFHTVGFSLVAKVSQKGRIGKNMGEFTSVGDIGRISIPPTAVFLVPIFGWRVTMLILSTLGLSLFILLRIFRVRKDVYQNKIKETHQQFLKQAINLLKNRKLFLTQLACIGDALASSAVGIFLPFLLLSKGIQVTEYGIIMGAFFVGSLAGKYLLGRGVDKFGNSKVFILSETLMAATLLILVFSWGFLLLFVISFLLGMFTRGTTPVIQTMMSETAHKIHYDKLYAISELLIGVAAMIIVILMGVLADKAGIYFVFYTSAILAVLAITPLLFLKLANHKG